MRIRLRGVLTIGLLSGALAFATLGGGGCSSDSKTGTAGSGGGTAGTGGAAGTGGRGGNGGMAGTGGASGTAGTGGKGGASGTGGSAPDAGIPCELDGGQCPAGYRCGCGGPGAVGMCTCHKECNSDNDCAAPNPMCGCSATQPAPRICVNDCFCVCG